MLQHNVICYLQHCTLHKWKGVCWRVSGTPHYLDEDEEKELVKFLLECAEVGYPKTVEEVRVANGQ